MCWMIEVEGALNVRFQRIFWYDLEMNIIQNSISDAFRRCTDLTKNRLNLKPSKVEENQFMNKVSVDN